MRAVVPGEPQGTFSLWQGREWSWEGFQGGWCRGCEQGHTGSQCSRCHLYLSSAQQSEIQLDLHLGIRILYGLDLCCRQVHSVNAFPLYVAHCCATSPFSFPQIHVNPSFTQVISLAFPAVQVRTAVSPLSLPGSCLDGYSMGSWKKEPGLRHWALKSCLVKTLNSSSFFWVKEVILTMRWRPLKQNMGVLALLKFSYLSWNIVNWLEKSQSRSFLAIDNYHT